MSERECRSCIVPIIRGDSSVSDASDNLSAGAKSPVLSKAVNEGHVFPSMESPYSGRWARTLSLTLTWEST